MKIVINSCFGGFSVSRRALHALRELGNEHAKKETDFGEKWPDSDLVNDHDYDGYCREIPRNDPQLIQVVEALGPASFGASADLRIVEIPDGVQWEIDEYDGHEHIAEKHRTWR